MKEFVHGSAIIPISAIKRQCEHDCVSVLKNAGDNIDKWDLSTCLYHSGTSVVVVHVRSLQFKVLGGAVTLIDSRVAYHQAYDVFV